jgi:NAD(P)H-dependent flavin oxidoreductase YrpB (nitropropane dioxygenase family)
LVPNLNMGDVIFEYIDICAKEGVIAIETAGADPSPYIKAIKDAGIKLVHKAPTVRHALRMQEKGADAITIAGFEVGGHPSQEAVGTFVLANKASRELKIPVMAAGGIADGRGLAAALTLGAQGVVMGGRFVASHECQIHENFKDLLVKAQENQTTLIQKSIRNMARVYNNEAAKKCLEMEAAGATLQELMTVIAGKITKECYKTGDLSKAIFACGPSIGLIYDVKSVADIMEDMVVEAEGMIKGVSKMFA